MPVWKKALPLHCELIRELFLKLSNSLVISFSVINYVVRRLPRVSGDAFFLCQMLNQYLQAHNYQDDSSGKFRL